MEIKDLPPSFHGSEMVPGKTKLFATNLKFSAAGWNGIWSGIKRRKSGELRLEQARTNCHLSSIFYDMSEKEASPLFDVCVLNRFISLLSLGHHFELSNIVRARLCNFTSMFCSLVAAAKPPLSHPNTNFQEFSPIF